MKKWFTLLFMVLSSIAFSQEVVGYWYGNANVKNGTANNYLVELILKQNKAAVTGILNYYFKNTYRSVQVTGTYNTSSRKLSFTNIPVTYYGSTSNFEVDCMMDFLANLRVAKAGSNLSGRFTGKEAYRNTCPELLFNIQLNKDASNQDSVLNAIRQFKEEYQVWRPTATDTLSQTIITRPVVNYVVTNEYKKRENVLAKEITVESDSVNVDFYDNGEIDGDSISVFYNNKLIAFNRLLSTKAVHFNIPLDTTKEVNEVTMFADNLGSIPPNTALMLISDGKNRYEVRLSSNLEKNATVRIRRRKGMPSK